MLPMAQGVAARVVIMNATLAGKPYGKVSYSRGIVAGKGMERTTRMEVEDGDDKYTISEKRVYSNGGVPTTVTRTITKGDKIINISLRYEGHTAVVTYGEGSRNETETFKLDEEGATIADESQFWFFGNPPDKGSKSTFWEFSLDQGKWVKQEVKYEGTARLKVGEKTVDAYRISIGKDVNFYVDEFGMPYKSVQQTPSGTLTLERTDLPPGDED